MFATITWRLFMCKPTHACHIVVLSLSCSPYCGIILYKQISYKYILISEHFYRGIFRTANGGIHIYSIYHCLMQVHSPIELYHRPLVGFILTKRDISNYHHPPAVVFLSEHVMTSQQRWKLCAGGGDSCVTICK